MRLCNYRLELRAGIFTSTSMQSQYEVWFTADAPGTWRVSKPVHFERAIELLKIMYEAFSTDASAMLLPEEFHIVGRIEPKQLTSGD